MDAPALLPLPTSFCVEFVRLRAPNVSHLLGVPPRGSTKAPALRGREPQLRFGTCTRIRSRQCSLGAGREQASALPFRMTRPLVAVSMGNPHLLVFTPSAAHPLASGALRPGLEPAIRLAQSAAAVFPRGVNVSFVDVVPREVAVGDSTVGVDGGGVDSSGRGGDGDAHVTLSNPTTAWLRVSTYEQGCGWTLACGSACCAASFAAVNGPVREAQEDEARKRMHAYSVTALLARGRLLLEHAGDGGVVWMTGPSTEAFRGVWRIEGAGQRR